MRNKDFLAIIILSVALAFLINFPSGNPIFNTVRNILGTMFILFFPGYLLASGIFEKTREDLGNMEKFVLGVGLSITITILVAILLHFMRIDITVANVMNPVIVATFIFGSWDYFKISTKRRIYFKDRNFLFLSVLTVVVLTVLIYASATTPSKEEFIEIYWKLSKTENLVSTSQMKCGVANCSLSGKSMVGDLDLDGEKFKAALIDLKTAERYDQACIDLNNNNVFCEQNEGPFKVNDTFFVDDNGFSIINLRENTLIAANFPMEVNTSSFKIGLIAKSHFTSVVDARMDLFVNDTIQETRTVTLLPNVETLEIFDVYLQRKGLYRVRIALPPVTLEKSDYIDFWVRRN